MDPEFEHFPMPINADGDGPETDPDKVTETICWSCCTTWPCDPYENGPNEDS